MESSIVPETASRFLAPLILESRTKLHQMALNSPLARRITGTGLSVLYFFEDRLRIEERRKISRMIADPHLYNPIKSFEPFSLIETTADFDYFDPETGLKISKDESYLSIHLGTPDGPPITNEDIKKGIVEVAKYIGYQKGSLPGDKIIGITYRKLASASRRYGFILAQSPLPDQAHQVLTKLMAENVKLNKDFDSSGIALCFQKFESLTQRYAPGAKPEWNRVKW